MRQRIILVTAAWLVGAAATASAATAALGALGAGLAGPGSRPMSQADVQRELSAAGPSGSPSALASDQPNPDGSRGAGSATAPPTSGTRVLSTVGGTIVAKCSGGQVTLVSWSPAQGYRADGATPGPANSAWVKFKAGRSELLVTVSCAGDQPKEVIATDDHH